MTEPYYSDDQVTLYHGDALDVLRQLPDASVDAVITDPPYSSGGMVRGDRMQDVKTKYVQSDQVAAGTGSAALADFTGDNRDQRGFGYWCALWLGQMPGNRGPGRGDRRLHGLASASAHDRRVAVRRPGVARRGSVAQTEWPAGAGPMGEPMRVRRDITQKPLDVMRHLVQIAPKGGTILDPFAGAGTTGVAAVLEGRRFVGVEITEHYSRVAADRIATAAQGYRDDGSQGVLPLLGEAL